jgi:hypothetical protein
MENAVVQRASRLRVSVVRENGQGTFEVRRNLNAVSVRARVPGAQGQDRTDHTYFLQANRLVAVDHLNAEWLDRKPAAGSGPVERLGKTLGELDEGVRLIANPADTRDFGKRLRAQTGWKVTPLGAKTRYEVGKGDNTIRLELRTADRLPVRVEFEVGKNKVAWNYRYESFAAPTAPATSGLVRVDSFIARPALPKFASPETEASVRAALRAHKVYNQGVLQFSTGETIELAGSLIGEKYGKDRWRYHQGTLSLMGQKGAFRGKCTRGEVLQQLAANGIGTVSNYARNLLSGKAPYRYELTSDYSAKKIGELALRGKTYQLIEFRNAMRRLVWQVDTKTRLIQRIDLEVFGSSGEVNLRQTVSMTYQNGKTLPPLSPSGGKWKPLPAINER